MELNKKPRVVYLTLRFNTAIYSSVTVRAPLVLYLDSLSITFSVFNFKSRIVSLGVLLHIPVAKILLFAYLTEYSPLVHIHVALLNIFFVFGTEFVLIVTCPFFELVTNRFLSLKIRKAE